MGKCTAACETTANMWITTVDAFEHIGVAIKFSNAYKMALISKTGKKIDKIDAEKIAQILRMDAIPECYIPSMYVRGIRNMGAAARLFSAVKDQGSKPSAQPA